MLAQGVGDFSLTEVVSGYWNKADGGDIEIDMVAIDETNRRMRFGSCKRAARSHDRDALKKFDQHVGRFLATKTGAPFREWNVERVLYAPLFTDAERAALSWDGFICVDLVDFERWLKI